MPLLSSGSALAQLSDQQLSELQNSRITVVYEPPTLPRFQALLERLQKRRVLEDLKAFLSPLRLPRKLVLNTKECGQVNAFYSRSEGLILCYEYIEYIEALAPKDTTPEGFTRQEGIAGAFAEVALHEIGHAVFDIFEAPVFGREEDAADQLAGFVMLQFSTDMTRLAIKGAAYSYLSQESNWAGTKFSDEHGTQRQRYYNYLCLAYGRSGGVPGLHRQGLLPRNVLSIAREYEQVKRAFEDRSAVHRSEPDEEGPGHRWIRPMTGRDDHCHDEAGSRTKVVADERFFSGLALATMAPPCRPPGAAVHCKLSELQNSRSRCCASRRSPRLRAFMNGCRSVGCWKTSRPSCRRAVPCKLTLSTQQSRRDNASTPLEATHPLLRVPAHLETLMSRETGLGFHPGGSGRGRRGCILHEMGHALFDILETPIFGREEDAADQMSAFVMLQFSTDMARIAIKGGGYYYLVTDRQLRAPRFQRGTGPRASATTTTSASPGADPVAFRTSSTRACCPGALHQLRANTSRSGALSKTVLPYIDEGLRKKVRPSAGFAPTTEGSYDARLIQLDAGLARCARI